MLFAGREVHIEKNCALDLCTRGLGSYARLQAQFFSTRTPRPANNIFLLHL